MGNRPVLAHSLMVLENSPVVDGLIVAVAKDRVDSALQLAKRFGCTKLRGIVIGGVSRLSTLRTVMAKLPEPAQSIAIVEASRPFLSEKVLNETIKAARRYGCAVAAHKLPDAAKRVPSGLKVTETLERNTVWLAQSPQVFRTEVLEKIIDPKNKKVKLIDDESEFVVPPAEVHLVETGAGGNMKIRTSDDLAVATALFQAKLT